MRNKVPGDVFVEMNGVCWRKGDEWARFDIKDGKWKKGRRFFGDGAEWEKVRA